MPWLMARRRSSPSFQDAAQALTVEERQAVAYAVRLLDKALRRPGECLSSPQIVADYLKLNIATRPHEVFVCLFLDAQNCLIEAKEMFRGTLTQTSVYPREIVREALNLNAAAVIWRILCRATKCALCAPFFYVPRGSCIVVDE